MQSRSWLMLNHIVLMQKVLPVDHHQGWRREDIWCCGEAGCCYPDSERLSDTVTVSVSLMAGISPAFRLGGAWPLEGDQILKPFLHICR